MAPQHRLNIKRIYDPPASDDGFRLLIMRRWPRGIAKDKIDAWDKGLAPSLELLNDYRRGLVSWDEYTRRYLWEIANRPDSIEAVATLRSRVPNETITLLCSCVNPDRCHRTLLRNLVEAPEP